MTIRLEPGDCLEQIPRLVAEGVAVDAIVTDPPYGLEFMGREWDSFRGSNSGIKVPKIEGPWARGKGSPVFNANRRNQKCPRCDKWSYDYPARKCLCGGAVAEGRRIYAVGFQEFCDSWLSVAYGALKPGGYLLAFGGTRTHHRIWSAIEDAGFVIQDTIMWLYGSGFPKGRTQLKPAFEPICIAYKPGGKRTLQIDECRITGAIGNANWTGINRNSSALFGSGNAGFQGEQHRNGRWPANVCHDGSDEVMEAFAAFPTANHGHHPARRNGNGMWSGDGGGPNGNSGPERLMTDTGSAARFYFCAKADVQDRWGSKHPTVKPVELISWLVKLVTPPLGLVLDPFAGSGTTAVAAMATGRNAILIERDETYCADIRERIAHYEGEGRHSIVARNRNRTVAPAPLFDTNLPPPD